MRMPRTLSATLLLGSLLALFALPADAQRRRDRDRDDMASRLDTTLALSPGGTVELEGAEGEMNVTGTDGNQVRIRATSERGQLRLDATSSRIHVQSVAMGWGDVRYEVSVPTGTRLLLSGRSTDIQVRGTSGRVEAQTQNGDIEITDAAEVEVNALNGDVALRTVEGVRVNLVAGEVRIDGVRGSVEAQTVSGDIEVRNAVSREVRAQTMSGNVFFDGTIDSGGRYDLTSHSGNVIVRVPANVSAAVSLQTYSGAMESDFPITLEGGAIMGGHPRSLDFRIGNGGARITVQSFSGTIHLQRTGTQNRQED
ncbi:MAG TPA: DUF4097 family beta strand repeat-containing protein [Gemmatimonadaceae bacterium]|nr:DUF4097 family beta strand repeat-containing protein [Gemmatimonadaceae bacterium]